MHIVTRSINLFFFFYSWTSIHLLYLKWNIHSKFGKSKKENSNTVQYNKKENLRLDVMYIVMNYVLEYMCKLAAHDTFLLTVLLTDTSAR